MKKLKLFVKNIYCSWCSKMIKKELLREVGIDKINIKMDASDTQVIVLIHKNKIKNKDIVNTLRKRSIEVLNYNEFLYKQAAGPKILLQNKPNLLQIALKNRLINYYSLWL